ncbi:hypothetical protein ACFWBN_02855 [Streptomyces sp. NPDC059989]|uniref:hypothetical protein n=1 Tax=Streptomyces sp. NPDC059989 TaxID=3347026 RepID=UPI0036B690A6
MSPTLPDADRLLASLEPLPHALRLRLMATTARDLARSGRLAPVLADLAGRGRYERRLAALGALAGRHTAHLTERLADPDPVVHRYVRRAVRTLPVPDEAIAAAYAGASATLRGRLAEPLLTGSRPALAERLVRELREQWGDREAAALLPACGPEFTARMLPELAPAVADWTRLARRHPGPVLDRAESELAALPLTLRPAWWERQAPAVAAAVPGAPERVLGLLERYGPGRLPGRLVDRLGDLAEADADRLVRWITAPERENGWGELLPRASVLRRIVRADPPSLPALGRRWADRSRHLAALLNAMPAGRRTAFHDEVTRGTGTRKESLPPDVLAALPRERRISEARRALAFEETGNPLAAGRLTLLAHLPVAEARSGLLAAVGDHEALVRAAGWEHLVANAGHARDRAALAEVLALMTRRLRNDRDPVRRAALDALAGLPASLFNGTPSDGSHAAEAVPDALGLVARHALDAPDCSPATRNGLQRLVFTVLAAPDLDPALLGWALDTLGLLTDDSGRIPGAYLFHTLPRARDRQLLDALRPWVDRAADKGDHRLLVELVEFLGERGRAMPEVQELLAAALRRCDDADFPDLARVWLRDPATRGDRVAELLAREPSAAALRPVREVLSAQRTDLLDGLLGTHPPLGRFLREGADRPLPELAHADRWLPRQQEAAARLAGAVVADESRTPRSRAAVLRGAARIPDLGPALVRRHAGAEQAVLAEAALGACARADEPAAALDELLAQASGDRARVAVYAAGRAAAGTAPDRLAELLDGLLDPAGDAKVTSRKEALRLAVRFLPPGRAARMLARAGLARDGHPDVLAAAVALAPRLLAFDAAWELMEAAAATGGPAARQAVLRTEPLDVAPEFRSRYGELVAALATAADRQAAALAVHVLPRWIAYAPGAGEAVRAAVCDLSRRDRSWRGAAQVLGEIAVSGLEHPVGGAAPGSLLHRTVEPLLAAVRAGEGPEAEEDGDLPARQRLRWLTTQAFGDDTGLVTALAGQLAGEPSLTGMRVELLVRTVDPHAPAPARLAALRELAAAHEGRPVMAAATAVVVGHRHKSADPVPDAAGTLELVRTLADDGETATGLFAAAILGGVGWRHDWPPEWRAQLRALRRHPEPEVRDAALATTTYKE